MGEEAALTPTMLAQVEALWLMKEEKQKAEMKEYLEMSRKASIEIRKREFSRPEDKRAVGFISDINYDLEDFFTRVKELLVNVDNIKEDPEVVDVTENKDKVTSFIKYCVKYGAKMSRKYNREFEDYQVANNSRGGWGTAKFFRQGELFDRSLKEKSWLEKEEEEGSEEKAKRLRNAERQAALDIKEKTKLSKSYLQRGGSGRKRTRFDSPSRYSAAAPSSSATSAGSSSSSYSPMKFGPGQLYYPPGAAQVQCYGCQGFGHIRKYCPKVYLFFQNLS